MQATDDMAKQKNDRTPRRDRPPSRPNADRDAAIYRRVFELREIDRHQAAQEYGVSTGRISGILTEEHQRRHGEKREPVRPDQERDRANADRNRELYERIIVRREIPAAEAAQELGVSKQRIAQILDKEHQGRYGEKRPPTTSQHAHAGRDAEIYDRVYARREIDRPQAAAEYNLTPNRITSLIKEEHSRRHGDAPRRNLLKPEQPSPRNLELYERVVVNQEITAAQAARELGIGPQRVGQLLDKTHLQLHGAPRRTPKLRGSKAQQKTAREMAAAQKAAAETRRERQIATAAA